jgi:hypothetical protein
LGAIDIILIWFWEGLNPPSELGGGSLATPSSSFFFYRLELTKKPYICNEEKTTLLNIL